MYTESLLERIHQHDIRLIDSHHIASQVYL